MKDVAKVKQLGSRDSDNLKNPKANVGDRKSEVVADVLTAGLLSVAHKVGLFIAPDLEDTHQRRGYHSPTTRLPHTPHPVQAPRSADLLSTSAQDQDAEHEQHREPDFSDHRGVALHLVQQPTQQIPLTHFSRQLS